MSDPLDPATGRDCQVCSRPSTCIHDEGAFCAECCPYEQAVRAERQAQLTVDLWRRYEYP